MELFFLELSNFKDIEVVEESILASELGYAVEYSASERPIAIRIYSTESLPLKTLQNTLTERFPDLMFDWRESDSSEWSSGWSETTTESWKSSIFQFQLLTDACLARFQPDSKTIGLIDNQVFGDGRHVATRLTLQALEFYCLKHPELPGSYLDFGCGNGVLPIAMQKMGIPTIWGTEVDGNSLGTAVKNCQINHAPGIQLVEKAQTCQKFELISCNIQPPLLYDVLSEVTNLLKEGGTLVLSGYTKLDQDAVRRFVEKMKFEYMKVFTEDGWISTIWQKQDL